MLGITSGIVSLNNVAVVIPCYKAASTIKSVINSIPSSVKKVIVVDDCCPENSGKIAEGMKKNRVTVIYRKKNGGVGAAVISGYRKALEMGVEVVVKMDGDGQMDPKYLKILTDPIIKEEADYVKGNRFYHLPELRKMPMIRLFGNSVLSFLVKLASGYWNIFDPTNGYTAINKSALTKLNLDRVSKRYFFESSMLINLNIANMVVKDRYIPAIYGNEKTSMKISLVILQFPVMLFVGWIKRVFFKYFLYDFNMASLFILFGVPVFLWSMTYGIFQWIESVSTGVEKSSGTIMLVSLPIILSFQMLLLALSIDIASVPKKEK